MPFGAHETMETHEILSEKINCITHFNLYAQEAKNPQLRDMILRHQQEEILSYNQIVSYTHDYIPFRPIPPNTDIQGINPQSIQYGLRNPPPMGPQDGSLTDRDIALAMLLSHKNGARNCTWASLEVADPNLRRMLMNSCMTCVNQAYETFLFMNEQGWYQVPTMNDHTAKTFLHSYQPVDSSAVAQMGEQSVPQSWQQGQSWQQPGQQTWQQQGQSWQQQGQQPGQQAWQQAGQQAGQQAWQQSRQPIGQQFAQTSWQQPAQQGQSSWQQGQPSWQQQGQQYGQQYGQQSWQQAGNNQNAGASGGHPVNAGSSSSSLYASASGQTGRQSEETSSYSASGQNKASENVMTSESEDIGSIKQ